MKSSLRSNTLAAIIGLTLAGAAWQVPVHAGTMPQPASAGAETAGVQTWIVEFAEAGLVSYRGGTAGIAATAPDRQRARKLDMNSAAARAYGDYLATRRATHLAAMTDLLGRGLEATHSYAITMNGVAVDLDRAEAARVARLPGVKSIRPAGEEYLTTYRGPSFIGADQVWSGNVTPGNVANRGEGVVVGIIDSGAYRTHPSFANDAACGLGQSNPKLLSTADCSVSSGGICTGGNPEANPGNGHGVHTAATAAGNTIDNTVTPAPAALPPGMTMSGVAPCAQIRSYKVCETSTCGGAAIVAGIENAIADGVDVINFSIGGGTSPWGDSDRYFLDATDADVFVAASAGNTRAGDTTAVGKVSHIGPWVTTVAASTQDQISGPILDVEDGAAPAWARDVFLNPGSNITTAATPTWSGTPIKFYAGNIEGCGDPSSAFPANYFAGSIALIRRGTCAFSDKVNNADAAGAVMTVIANNEFGMVNMNTDAVPAGVLNYSIYKEAGDALLDYLAGAPAATASVAPLGLGATPGDLLADFSYRGPTRAPFGNITKPDITGPGVQVYAATDASSGTYQFMSGTSMSSPHVAGAAALVRAVHPTWSPIEVKSALMTTASIPGLKDDGSGPWDADDVGGGSVRVNQAVQAGLTLDETKARFLAANPSAGGDLRTLNLPAVRDLDCLQSCTFTRTVRNRLGTSGTWNATFQVADTSGISASVSPASFTLAPDQEQEVTITVAPPAGPAMTEIGFGHVFFTEAASQAAVQHFTVAILGDAAQPDLIFADGFEDTGAGPFFDDFDSYAANSNIHGQGGWKGWGNDPAAGAQIEDRILPVSSPNVVAVQGGSDLIHEFAHAAGSWTVTAQQFIPASFNGESYFIFENVYDDVDINVVSWSTQVAFDSVTDTVRNPDDAADPFSAPLIRNRWVELKLVIDLDNDLQTFYYDGVEMYSGSWTMQFPNQSVPGVKRIGSIDLFANGATPIYYDNVRIEKTQP